MNSFAFIRKSNKNRIIKLNVYYIIFNMKKLLNLIFFVFVIFIFTSKLFASEERIKIGLLLPLTGQNQEVGKSVLRSVNLAINKIDDPI